MRGNPAIEQVQRWRLLVVALAITTVAALVVQRLFWYQVADHERFVAMAAEEHQDSRPLAAKRGAIVDASGHPLAMSVMYDDVYVYTPEIRNLSRAAETLSSILTIPVDKLLQKIQADDRQWNLLASQVPADVAAQIEAAELPGVELRSTRTREYPEGSIAAQVLGFVGAEGHGLSGLELTLDEQLGGKDGIVITERDTVGGEITIGRKALDPPVSGSDVVLTIDRYVQRVAERELEAAVKANKAVGGSIIVMEPSTGAILAMASNPTYSLTAEPFFRPDQQQLYKPVGVTDTYEPGSVMKVVTMAGAIEQGVVTPDSMYQDRGVAVVSGVPIRNWDGGAYGNVTVRDIIVHSLNTGTQWVASLVGAERFYQNLEAFGFGAQTGVPLNGESPGSFRRPSDPGWSILDLATNSFGQSISVTPLQMITAMAAIGNGGVLVQPQLVREIRGPNGVEAVAPKPVRQAVSPRTAETVLDMMVSAWDQPTLQAQRVEGYRLAAKSGTAGIPEAGGYSPEKTYASFGGFAPVPNPWFAILVRIDQPEAMYGGIVAAPVFSKIAQELLRYYRVPPTETR
ncbi:MAG: hypothetical protein GEU73_06525 [Chloroflexi bacterium]|nr:hypothetical protein [Chloroflexota bacterium]